MTRSRSCPQFASGPVRSWSGDEMAVAFLGSGSSGNCTVVRGPGGAVVVDSGFSAREVLRRLALAGGSPEEVVAILVTHEHSDHLSGVGVLARKLKVPVYATAGTRRRGSLDASLEDVRGLAAGHTVSLAGLAVLPFRASHDAEETVAFRFEAAGGESAGILTDTGVMTAEAIECLEGVCVLGLESNHDERMLIDGPYPAFLKRRILSERGHLSNAAAAQAIERLASDRLVAVFGMHLSRTNNEPDRARKELEGALRGLDLKVPVAVVPQGCAEG